MHGAFKVCLQYHRTQLKPGCACTSHRTQRQKTNLLLQRLVDTVLQVVMGQFNLPSGTLGFVFSAIAVVCCSNLLESNVEDTAAARGLDSANITASLPRSSRSGYIRSTAVSVKGVSQLSLFDNDLRFHGLDVQSALETALDDVQSGGVTAPFISMRRITRFALNAAVPEEVDAPAHAFGGLTGGHKREGYGRTMIQVNSPA